MVSTSKDRAFNSCIFSKWEKDGILDLNVDIVVAVRRSRKTAIRRRTIVLESSELILDDSARGFVQCEDPLHDYAFCGRTGKES
jgi:hypothetical protein